MFDLDQWKEILQTLSHNKTRSILTAFGIFWGVFMLVLLLGGSQGFKTLMERNFDGFAQNSYCAMAQPTTRPYKGFQRGRSWHLTMADLRLVQQRVPGVERTTPLIFMSNPTYTYQQQTGEGMVKGVREDFQHIENPVIVQGRYLQTTDLTQFRKVCVIGKEVYNTLFPNGESPLGKFIQLGDTYFQVVGLSGNESRMSIGGNSANSIMIPITTLQRLENRGNSFDLLALTAHAGYSISQLQPQIEAVLKSAHDVAPDDKGALMSINIEAMFQSISSLFTAINTLVWLIGIGTLISGVIGVGNIMMVVVRERTTEIGIRRAIGARPFTILRQILSESIVLTISAGLSGIVLAVLLLALLEMGVASGMPTTPTPNFQIPFGLALAAAFVLSLLGTLAGVAPALRALAIKPIEAIRDE